MSRVAYWESHGGKSVKGQRCKVCNKPLKESRIVGEICATPFINHYLEAHGLRLESNSRLGAWEIVEPGDDDPGSTR